MKVKELIEELKKMPQNAIVYTADHDHSDLETNSKVKQVESVNQNDLDDYAKERLEKDPYFKIKGTYVVLRT